MQSQILIGGNAYTLKLSVSGMIAAEASIAPRTIASVFSPAQDLMKLNSLDDAKLEIPSVEVLAKLFYSCLRSSMPEITMEGACELLDKYLDEAVEATSALTVLYMLLGQACGFFKGAENPQKLLNRAMASKKGSAKGSKN